MTSTLSKSNKNNLVRNTILAIITFAIVFIIGLYIHASLDKLNIGDPYTMNYVELFEPIQLKSQKDTISYDFIAKKNSDRIRIIFHFKQLNEYSSSDKQKLRNFYKDVKISVYDESINKPVYIGIIDENQYIDSPDITIYLKSLLQIQKNHQYTITIENLPYKTNMSGYDSFILVVGNVEKPWL